MPTQQKALERPERFVTEKTVKQEIKAYLQARNIYYFFPSMNGYGRAGIPDIVICYKGRFIAVECKGELGSTTAWQEREIHAIGRAGGIAVVAKAPGHLEAVKDALSLV